MSTADVARAFTDALKSGRPDEAERLWSEDVASFEAYDGPMKEARGRAAVHAKGEWWVASHEIHSFETFGPYLHGDQFALRFRIDATARETGQRSQMEEVGLYTVRDGRIVEERFFY